MWGQHCCCLGPLAPCSGPAGRHGPPLSQRREDPQPGQRCWTCCPGLVCRKVGPATARQVVTPLRTDLRLASRGLSFPDCTRESDSRAPRGVSAPLPLPPSAACPSPATGSSPSSTPPPAGLRHAQGARCLHRLRAHPPAGSTQAPRAAVNGRTARPRREVLDKVPFSRVGDGLQCSRRAWTTQVPVLHEWCSLLVTRLSYDRSTQPALFPQGVNELEE